jgi:1-acyl-sn-glycerol-3-phosphate acyltransferase
MTVDPERYRRLHRTLGAVVRGYTRLEVSGLRHVPREGGAVFCPRHENLCDPFLLCAALGPERPLHFLAWEGVFQIPLVGPWIESLGMVHTIKAKLGRSQDVSSVRRTMTRLRELVDEGHAVAVFPEGNINHWFGRGGVKPFRSGAIRLAARAGVPIVPVGSTGTRWVVPSLFNFHDLGGPDFAPWIPIALPAKVRVRFGAPIVVDPAAAQDKDVAEEEARRLQAVVQTLVDEIAAGARDDQGAIAAPASTPTLPPAQTATATTSDDHSAAPPVG